MYIPTILISYFTGGQDFNNFNIQLLAPPIQKLVPRKYRHVELKPVHRVDLIADNNDDVVKKPNADAEWILKSDEEKTENKEKL